MGPEEFWLNASKCFKYRLMDLKNLLVEAKNARYPQELVNVNTSEQEMVVLVGFPGSGKSTLYRRFFAGNNYKHINCDQMKTMDKCRSECKKYILQKHSVVIDNTNPSSMSRMKFVSLAKMKNIKIRCVWLQLDKTLAYHLMVIRWRSDQKKKKIPVIAYQKYQKEFNAPQSIEGFQSIIKVPFVFDGHLLDEKEFLLHT